MKKMFLLLKVSTFTGVRYIYEVNDKFKTAGSFSENLLSEYSENFELDYSKLK